MKPSELSTFENQLIESAMAIHDVWSLKFIEDTSVDTKEIPVSALFNLQDAVDGFVWELSQRALDKRVDYFVRAAHGG